MQSIVQLEIEGETTQLKIASGQDALQPEIHSEDQCTKSLIFSFLASCIRNDGVTSFSTSTQDQDAEGHYQRKIRIVIATSPRNKMRVLYL